MIAAVDKARWVCMQKIQDDALYPEWDLDIDDYKPDWAQVTEYTLHPGETGFVEQVNDEYGTLIGQFDGHLRPFVLRV